MDKDLERRLTKILKGQRPRPVVRCADHNGKKCYVRKRNESYFETLEKHRRPWWYNFARPLKRGPMKLHFFGLLK